MVVTVSGGHISDREKEGYISYARNKYKNRTIKALDICIDGDYADIRYTFAEDPFERIRRITGYLVGTTDRFNNAKRAEESDRVKHSI